MEEEDKYYIIYKENRFKGFLIAKTVEKARKEIAFLGDDYMTNGIYITKKSRTGID